MTELVRPPRLKNKSDNEKGTILSLFCYFSIFIYSIRKVSDLFYGNFKKNSFRNENDKADNRALIRSTAEWFIFVLSVTVICVIIYTAFFKIFDIDVNNKKINVLVLSNGYTLQRGDTVIAKNTMYADIIACEGESIPLNTDGSPMLESITYKKQVYGKNKISELLDDGNKIPKGFVLVTNLEASSEFSAELMENDDVNGRIEFVIYPYIYLGKSVYEAVGE